MPETRFCSVGFAPIGAPAVRFRGESLGLGLEVFGSGFKVKSLGFNVQDSGPGCKLQELEGVSKRESARLRRAHSDRRTCQKHRQGQGLGIEVTERMRFYCQKTQGGERAKKKGALSRSSKPIRGSPKVNSCLADNQA